MSTPARLVGFAVVVLVGLGGGYVVGAAVGPLDPPAPSVGTVPPTAVHPTAVPPTTGHDTAGHGS